MAAKLLCLLVIQLFYGCDWKGYLFRILFELIIIFIIYLTNILIFLFVLLFISLLFTSFIIYILYLFLL